MMNVTFIGLGIMGSRMAENLLTNGVALTVFNRSEAPMVELQKKGAKVAGSAQQAVQEADIVFTMLSTPEVVAEVAWSESGFIAAMTADRAALGFSSGFIIIGLGCRRFCNRVCVI